MVKADSRAADRQRPAATRSVGLQGDSGGQRTWVGLTMILFIPLSAVFCLGRGEFGS